MIEFKKICKRFSPGFAIKDISFKTHKGHCTVILGESGSGKSSIVRMLIGLIQPDSGEILLDGEPFFQSSMREHQKKFGYVIQSYGLFPHLSAWQNVAIAWQGKKLSKKDLKTKVEETAVLCHFHKERLKNYPAEMSGGEKQRVSLMRALINDPDYLIMDEPLGALDPITRSNLQKELKEIFTGLRKTVILVTHDLAEAKFFSDEIVLMKDGRIVQKGSFEELENQATEPFVRKFINAFEK